MSNTYFNRQCTTADNESTIPSTLYCFPFLQKLSFNWSKILTKVQLTDRMKLLKKMLKLCAPSVCKPLTFIFEKYRVWKFSWCLKCLLIKNWPVSIGIFDFTDTRNIILAYESVLCDGEFSVYQLTSIFHELYNAYDKNPSLELTEVFLDISKALERVCHKAILDKIKCMDIDGNFSKLVESFLSGLTLMK